MKEFKLFLDDLIKNMTQSLPIEDGSILVHRMVLEGSRYIGSLVRSQRSDISPIFDETTNELKPIALQVQESIGHPTVFILEKNLRILAIESTMTGVSIKHFCDLLKKNFSHEIIFELVLKRNAYERFESLDILKNVVLEIAALDRGDIFKNAKSGSLLFMSRLSDKTRSGTMFVSLKADKKASLDKGEVESIVDFFRLKSTDSHIKQLIVKGRKHKSISVDVINFIQDKMIDKLSVTRAQFRDENSITERLNQLRQKFSDRYIELEKMFKP
jgi:hypothetical protein